MIKSQKEKVSIVIPVYNRRELVVRCLDSVLAQTWRPLRVIVADNNSTDGTPDAVREWARSRGVGAMNDFSLLVVHEQRPGASAARNRGLREVSSRFVIFFDSDDEMLPTLVEEAMAAAGDAQLVFWRAARILPDGKECLLPYHTDDLLKRHLYNSMLSTQTYMVSTDLVRGVGGWAEDAAVWNDWELGVRLALARPRVAFIPGMLVRIYPQADSITGRRFADKRGQWERTLDMVEATAANLDEPMQSRILDMVDYRRAILLAQYRREGFKEMALSEWRRLFIADHVRSLRLSRPALLWLHILMLYTAAGGRGAYYLWRR